MITNRGTTRGENIGAVSPRPNCEDLDNMRINNTASFQHSGSLLFLLARTFGYIIVQWEPSRSLQFTRARARAWHVLAYLISAMTHSMIVTRCGTIRNNRITHPWIIFRRSFAPGWLLSSLRSKNFAFSARRSEADPTAIRSSLLSSVEQLKSCRNRDTAGRRHA